MRKVHLILLTAVFLATAYLWNDGRFHSPLPNPAPATGMTTIEAGLSVPDDLLADPGQALGAIPDDRFNFAVEHLATSGPVVSRQQEFDAGKYGPAVLVDSLPKLTWQMLRDVKYKEKWNEAEQMHFNYPVFGNKVKALAGKEYYVTGYMIPLDAKGGLYAVSANPYAACYFCGQSGPETIVSVKFSKIPKRYKTDDIVNIRGTLRLNEADVNDFIYVFERASDYDVDEK